MSAVSNDQQFKTSFETQNVSAQRGQLVMLVVRQMRPRSRPAWKMEVSSYMARIAKLIESGDAVDSQENEQQYRFVSEYIYQGAAS